MIQTQEQRQVNELKETKMARNRVGAPSIVRTINDEVQVTQLQQIGWDEFESESWLQQTLAAAPGLIPIREIDPRVVPPLVSLGREVGVATGHIDNLFLSSNGHLVVVETKLWRNPQSRRQVVSQILDYAAHIRHWRYTDLERLADSPEMSGGSSLYEWVDPKGIDEQEWDEQEWIDHVNDNLVHGRLTLLIVGDGIRSEAEELARVVAGRPDLEFKLALLEMAVFDLGDGSMLAVPSVVAKTREIRRATVTIKIAEGSPTPEVHVDAAQEDAPKKSGSRISMDLESLIDTLRDDEDGDKWIQIATGILDNIVKNPPLVDVWRSSGYAVRMQSPADNRNQISLFFFAGGESYLYSHLPWLRDQVNKAIQDANKTDEIVANHLERIRNFGGFLDDKGANYYFDDADMLVGREAEFVDALMLTAKEIQQACKKAVSG